MKKSSIIGLVVIAIAVAIIISTSADASAYVTFATAKEMAEKGQTKMIHVVGKLKRTREGKPVGVEPAADKLSVSFLMVDEEQQEQQVFLNDPMPADLLMSEQVVVVGSYKGEVFVADRVLLKCPSKYEAKGT